MPLSSTGGIGHTALPPLSFGLRRKGGNLGAQVGALLRLLQQQAVVSGSYLPDERVEARHALKPHRTVARVGCMRGLGRSAGARRLARLAARLHTAVTRLLPPLRRLGRCPIPRSTAAAASGAASVGGSCGSAGGAGIDRHVTTSLQLGSSCARSEALCPQPTKATAIAVWSVACQGSAGRATNQAPGEVRRRGR